MSPGGALPDSAFVVLAVLLEGDNHGYGIERLIHNCGFRFWANLQRSSIYKALALLEAAGLVAAREGPGAGPVRKVYRITNEGRQRLCQEGPRKLAEPGHPRSENRPGRVSAAVPGTGAGTGGLARCREHLRGREAFLAERLAWCRQRGLAVPALAFERPLLALRAELQWLDSVTVRHAAGAHTSRDDWAAYVYKDPPNHSA